VNIGALPVFIHARNFCLEDFIPKRWCIIFSRRWWWCLDGVQQVLDGLA
jgi:hypothetical protein